MMQHLDPERTETDLYLWLVDHLREVRDQFGDEAPSKKISDALVDFLKERKMDVPDELKSEDDDSMILSRTQIMKAVEDLKARENGHQDEDEDKDST
jgi:hypothetical protein